MEVGQEYLVHVAITDAEFRETKSHAASAVEEQRFARCFDKNAGAVTLEVDRRPGA
jgi:hypothetical protein